MRTELQQLEHWLTLLASHIKMSGMYFDDIHTMCGKLSDDLDTIETSAMETRMTVQAQHERICDLERIVSDLVAEGEAAAARAENDADINDRLCRARHGGRAE